MTSFFVIGRTFNLRGVPVEKKMRRLIESPRGDWKLVGRLLNPVPSRSPR